MSSSCGRCNNCKHMRSDVCENTNSETGCGAYGFKLDGWTGGQGEYVFVPCADFNLLALPDEDTVMAKTRNFTALSDVVPRHSPDSPARASELAGLSRLGAPNQSACAQTLSFNQVGR